jgi:hypothetical protein
MNGAKTLTQIPNSSLTYESDHSPASKAQAASHRTRNRILLALAVEVAFLATLAVYEFSSLSRFHDLRYLRAPVSQGQ